MRKVILSALVMVALTACGGGLPGASGDQGRYEVIGVDEGDMLKMRSGPGIGHDVYVGLPNGAIVRVWECSRIGNTRWCKVALDRAPALTGYVSQSYLRKL